MYTSVALAKIIGPLFLIIGLGVLINLKTYRKMIDEFIKSPALVYYGSFLSLAFGLIIIQFHNIWALNWAVIITIFGWLGLLKGIALIMFPKSMLKITEPYVKSKNSLKIRLIVVIILGLVLTWMGFACSKPF